MPVVSYQPNYLGQVRDSQDQFNGHQLLFIEWLGHLSIASPIAVLVKPEMTFQNLIDEVLATSSYVNIDDWKSIDWTKVLWTHFKKPMSVDLNATLEQAGLSHKSIISFETPELTGI
ncbi:MAG: phenol hydroxylase subunit P4 [Acinetobacter sp.]